MPQDGSSSAAQNNDTHDVEMIDDDISVITPKTHPPGNCIYHLPALFYVLGDGKRLLSPIHLQHQWSYECTANLSTPLFNLLGYQPHSIVEALLLTGFR